MNPPNGGLAGCAGRKRNPEGGATLGIMVSLDAILSFASLSWSWSWSIVVVVVFSLVVVGGSPLLRRRPLAKRVIYDPEKRTNSNQGVIQNTTKSPATSKQTEREREETEPAQPRRGIGSQPHFDGRGGAPASAMLLQHLQISHLRIANRTLGGEGGNRSCIIP